MRHARTTTTKHRHRTWPACAWLVGLTMIRPASVDALTTVDPTLEVTTFSAQTSVSIALPGPAAAGFDAFLYVVARGDPPRIDQLVGLDATGAEVSRRQLALDAAVLTMGAGAYTGRIFLSEFALPDSFPDGLYELNPDGTVTLFSNLGGGNPDTHGVAFGDGGSFGNSIYVANPTSGTTDPRAATAIVRLNDDGSVADNLVSDPAGPYYLALTPAASKAEYGDYIYYTLLSASQVMRVDAAGNASVFATLPTDERGIALNFGIGGAFGNSLYVLVNDGVTPANRRLIRILPDGTVQTVATGPRGFRLAFDPVSTDMFTADEAGGILRIGASSCVVEGAGTLRFGTASRNVTESDGVVQINVSRSCGTAGAVSVGYLLTPGTAVPADDYLHPSSGAEPQTDTGTLVFEDGVDEQSIAIGMVDNDATDGTRTFTIELLTPAGGAELGDPSRLTVSILDDDAGADLSVESITFTRLSSSIATFPGLTGGFNDLRHRYRVVARIRNNGPAAISNFSVELAIPKEHLAGYGQAPGSSCAVMVLDPADPDFVYVTCTGLSLGAGESLDLPSDAAAFYAGYASVVPRNAGFAYHASVRTLGATVQDTDSSNDTRSATLVPRTNSGSRSGSGSISSEWLALFGLLMLSLRHRRIPHPQVRSCGQPLD